MPLHHKDLLERAPFFELICWMKFKPHVPLNETVFVISLWSVKTMLLGWVYARENEDTPKRHQECDHTEKTMWGHSEKPRSKPLEEAFYVDNQPPEQWEKKFLLFKPPVGGILLWQSWLTNMHTLTTRSTVCLHLLNIIFLHSTYCVTLHYIIIYFFAFILYLPTTMWALWRWRIYHDYYYSAQDSIWNTAGVPQIFINKLMHGLSG